MCFSVIVHVICHKSCADKCTIKTVQMKDEGAENLNGVGLVVVVLHIAFALFAAIISDIA